MINNILKESTINNKESLINDILKEQPIILKESTNNSVINKQPTIDKESTTIKKPTINRESTINNLNPTPEWLKPKKAILNPLNKDDKKSFQYSITLSLHHKDIGSNPCRIKNIESFINNFNWENINFPPQEQDCQQLETNNNSIALNILTSDSQQKIIHLYQSKYNKTRENKVILLQLQNNHYTSVKKLNSLLKTKNDSSKNFCINCLQKISTIHDC